MKGWLLTGKVLGVGWYVGLCLIAGILGGIWLDGKLGTGPLFVFLGLIVGLVLAFWGVYHILLPSLKDKD